MLLASKGLESFLHREVEIERKKLNQKQSWPPKGFSELFERKANPREILLQVIDPSKKKQSPKVESRVDNRQGGIFGYD